ncbi:MAG: hemolysin, partial [Myxococcota bacterium]|nr:hemolysin [Myxococcota bacterium]
FDADGAAEVVFADEVAFYVFDGATGSVIYQHDDHVHGTAWEYPVIADVDLDGNAEIIVGSTNASSAGWNGITVIGDASASWAPSRTIWNQHAYHITNVNTDGTIPETQQENWLTWNNFRAGGTELGPSHWLAD